MTNENLRPAGFAPRHFFHLAEPANWPSIRRHGLLSTERLLDLAKVPKKEREAILFQHRPQSVVLANGVIIRDQKPMPPHLLARALPKDVTPSAWYHFLSDRREGGFVLKSQYGKITARRSRNQNRPRARARPRARFGNAVLSPTSCYWSRLTS